MEEYELLSFFLHVNVLIRFLLHPSPDFHNFFLSNDMDIKAFLDVAILREYLHCEIGMAWSNTFISLSNLINRKGIKEIVLGNLREESLLLWFSFFHFPTCPGRSGIATGLSLWIVRQWLLSSQNKLKVVFSEQGELAIVLYWEEWELAAASTKPSTFLIENVMG